MSNRAYLFVWNHKNYELEKLLPTIDKVKDSGFAIETWSISAHQKVKIGDRAFVARVNSDTKGVFASGTIISAPYPFLKYNGKTVPGVDIEFDVFLNPVTSSILKIEDIELKIENQDWSPRKSGITINSVEILENIWSEFCAKHNVFEVNIDYGRPIIEGTSYQLTQTIYERSRYARMLCLEHHGYSCAVCDFNFEKKYGEIGKEFIHVHHINQLSNIREEHKTNPIIDLCPVCANCHAMLHKANPPYTIQELQKLMRGIKVIN